MNQVKIVFVLVVVLSACDGKPSLPTSPSSSTPAPAVTPSPAPASVRTITVKGKAGERSIEFGEVEVGSEAYKAFLVCNDGNTVIKLSAITGPEGYVFDTGYWDEGEFVSAGTCREAGAFFLPSAVQPYNGTVTVEADHTDGTNTITISGLGRRPSTAPRTVFGEGFFVVGIGIAPGRYFADPNGACPWSRFSKFPPSWPDDYIVSRETWFDPGQWVVDILPSDVVFISNPGCGWWSRGPVVVPDTSTINPGLWVVRTQVRAGRYRAEAASGCYWERLRHFEGTPAGVIASATLSEAGRVEVDIVSSDVGFHANRECGQWRRQ